MDRFKTKRIRQAENYKILRAGLKMDLHKVYHKNAGVNGTEYMNRKRAKNG